ncbi:hypothetical protein MBLNU230_g4438t1 [Neophaeotheca triangularis]
MASSRKSILVVNPNTTQAMTDALPPLVHRLGYTSTDFTFFTAPSGVPSINNEDDAAVSMEHCLPSLIQEIPDYDAFLICCYSHHPLVAAMRTEFTKQNLHHKAVTGIFEASVATCLQTITPPNKFGIVSTGSQWVDIMNDAIRALLGTESSSRYAGTETTGLDANELHSAPKAEVDRRMKEATGRLLQNGAKAICLGCAGMAGLDLVVREACVATLGQEAGQGVKIVDGVVSGVNFLEGALRAEL